MDDDYITSTYLPRPFIRTVVLTVLPVHRLSTSATGSTTVQEGSYSSDQIWINYQPDIKLRSYLAAVVVVVAPGVVSVVSVVVVVSP